jgi:hypothetical protein
MPQALVVVRPFADHKRGDTITDAKEIARVLGSELRTHVVRVATANWQTGAQPAKES